MKKVKPSYYYRHIEGLQWCGNDVFYCVGTSNKITRWIVCNNGRNIKKEK